MPLVPQAAIDMVRAYTEGNMDGLVTVLRGGPGVLNKTTGVVGGVADAVQIYGDPVTAGQIGTIGAKARVHPVSGQGTIALGPGQIDQRQTVVSIPWLAPMPQRDDIVLIRSGGQDNTLVGTALRVTEVDGGGLFGDARRMSCTMFGKSSYWDGVQPK